MRPAVFSIRKPRIVADVCSKASVYRKGAVNKAVVVGDDYPALLRARRRRERWSAEDRRLYQRHRWLSEGFHGEAKTWHGLARAVRRGLANMKIQGYLTAAAVNLKAAGCRSPCSYSALDRLLECLPGPQTHWSAGFPFEGSDRADRCITRVYRALLQRPPSLHAQCLGPCRQERPTSRLGVHRHCVCTGRHRCCQGPMAPGRRSATPDAAQARRIPG